MRTIDYTVRFKRDYKRELKGQHRATLDAVLKSALDLLLIDAPLPARMRDHSMTGNYDDHRDCHIKPDLVLIYRKPNEASIELVRIGSHSELRL